MRKRLSTLLVTLLLAATSACSDAGTEQRGVGGAAGSGGAELESVSVMSWWKDADGLALAEAAKTFESMHDAVAVQSITIGEESALLEAIGARLSEGLPAPDVFQRPQGGLERLTGPAAALGLDELYDSEGWSEAMPSELVAAHSTFEGARIAIPTNVVRTNTIYYDPRVFEGLGLGVPKTIDELRVLAKSLSNDPALTPLLLGNGDASALWHFAANCLAPHSMGPDHARDFFQGRLSGDDEKFVELLELVLYFRCGEQETGACSGYFNEDADTLLPSDATKRFLQSLSSDSPTIALYPADDTVRVGLEQAGFQPGEDFGVFACPVASSGDEPVFTGRDEGFVLSAEAGARPAALDFARFLGSQEGQLAINAARGGVPARIDVDLGADPLAFDAIQVEAHRALAQGAYWWSGQPEGTLPNVGRELTASMQAGSIEIIQNYVRSNYSTLEQP
jgi:glucose/mannose transport system substrate-binding protein